MRRSYKFFICAALLFVLAAVPLAAQATTSTPTVGSSTPDYVPPEIPINPNLPFVPGIVPISGDQGQGPAGLVANLYTYAFLIAGFLAFAMIVYGGVRYTFSAGNHSAQSDAKDAIKQALLGLGLLFVAYMILRTINPDLTNLRLPTLDKYVPPVGSVVDPGGGVSCDGELTLQPIDPKALPFENGDTVSFTSDNVRVQMNLDYLKEQWDAAWWAASQDANLERFNIRVNSAYRPISYQRHLHQVFLASKSFQNDPTLAARCPEAKAEVDREMDHHGLGDAVAAPSCKAPHVRGTAIDIGIAGSSNLTEDQLLSVYRELDILFEKEGVDLVWQQIKGDPYHFNTRKSPFRDLAACE
jgi:hypothetical protein